MYSEVFKSPVAWIEIQSDEHFIRLVRYCDLEPGAGVPSPLTTQCAHELNEYFAGKRQKFTVPVLPEGTDFQQKVWSALQDIPYGATVSYLELARRLGDEKKIRAAGTANGRNPVPLLIPCHRVIGSQGSLVGYGGGLWRKKFLLELERGAQQQDLFQ